MNEQEKPPERIVPELDKEPPKRVWLPEGVIRLAAVSADELELVEGDWWVRESSRASAEDGERVAALEASLSWALSIVEEEHPQYSDSFRIRLERARALLPERTQ